MSNPSQCSLSLHKKGSAIAPLGAWVLHTDGSHCFLADFPKLPGSSWRVDYTPGLPRPFAPVYEIWTLPSGWQVTETCKALQSLRHKVYKVLWASGMDWPLVILPSTDPRGKPISLCEPGELCTCLCASTRCVHARCDSAHAHVCTHHFPIQRS